MSDLPLLPDQPSTTDQIRRFGPPAVLALVAFLFIVQNTRAVSFTFLWFDFQWPLWIVLVVFTANSSSTVEGRSSDAAPKATTPDATTTPVWLAGSTRHSPAKIR